MSDEVLDNKIFKRFCMILKGKANNHIEMLEKGCSDLVEQMKKNDFDAVVFNAHKLKSSAGQMGAMALSSHVAKLEEKLTVFDEATGQRKQASGESASQVVLEMFEGLEPLITETLVALRDVHSQLPT